MGVNIIQANDGATCIIQCDRCCRRRASRSQKFALPVSFGSNNLVSVESEVLCIKLLVSFLVDNELAFVQRSSKQMFAFRVFLVVLAPSVDRINFISFRVFRVVVNDELFFQLACVSRIIIFFHIDELDLFCALKLHKINLIVTSAFTPLTSIVFRFEPPGTSF